MSSEETDARSKKRFFVILFLLLLLLLAFAVVFLKSCGEKSGDNETTAGEARTTGPSAPIADLLDPIPTGAGPFATRIGGEGPVYFIHTDPETGVQSLRSESGDVISHFSNADRKAWIAGYSGSRVLIFYTDPGTTLTHPRETWDVRQHFSISPSSPKFGIGPIIHSEETVSGILQSLE